VTSGGERFRVVHLDELEQIDVAGVHLRPIRRRLGVRAFGVNAFTASDGELVIEPHDETGVGSGKQEELYVVVGGRALFTVAGEEIDAPAGTCVFIPDLTARRQAVAREDGTTVLAVGAPAERKIPVSPFEYWFAAEPAYRAGDYKRAVEIASEGLDEWSDHPVLHYQLACYQALGGNRAEALRHIKVAFAGDSRAREWASDDTDLDSIRNDPDFPR
jgi:hypothetical protein